MTENIKTDNNSKNETERVKVRKIVSYEEIQCDKCNIVGATIEAEIFERRNGFVYEEYTSLTIYCMCGNHEEGSSLETFETKEELIEIIPSIVEERFCTFTLTRAMEEEE